MTAQNKVSADVKAFQVQTLPQEMADLKQRIVSTRWPEDIRNAEWSYGVSLPYLRELADYWANQFDWKAQEQKINAMQQFTVDIDGQQLHFVYEKGHGQQNTPIVLLHGWPSSFLQMTKIIPLLTQADENGQAFDVIIPSLPGYGFSGKATEKGMTVYQMAEICQKLMVDKLGYSRFLLRGSDIGAGVAKEWAISHPANVLGLHLSGSNPYVYQVPAALSAAEKQYLEQGRQFMQTEGAYAMEQSTKPHTLAVGLNDSPVGLAAWMVEKYKSWSDNSGDVEQKFSKDDLLSIINLYWFTQTIGSSMRIYYESAHQPSPNGYKKVEVPTAFMMLQKDIAVAPREWEARTYNIVRWHTHPTGGHFGEWEEPAVIAGDIRAFSRQLK